MKNALILILCLFAFPCFGQEIKKVSLPTEVKKELKCSASDPSIDGKNWNKWTSKNFNVLCLDNQQAQYLHQHLELVKTWAFARWGLYDVDFGSECRLICVDDPVLFKKMFHLDHSKVEIRRDDKGKIELSVIFLLLNDAPSQVVPTPVSEVCLAEFEQKYNAKFAWWAVRGVSLLNGSMEQIKGGIKSMKSDLDANREMFFSKALMQTDKVAWEALTPEKRVMFDRSAMTLMLLLRKEFGENKVHWMINKTANNTDPEKVLITELGFKNYDDFDRTFKRYMQDLSNDVAADKTPESYLQITAAAN